jgi:hypothetical protein
MEGESDDADFGVEVEDSEAKPGNSEFDNLVARYFGDVRQFALLNRSQEKELWQDIEDAQTRLRRALCTSPTALPTLTRLWHQVELEEIPLDQVFSDLSELTDEDQAARRTSLGETVVTLQDLAQQLRKLRTRRRATSRSAAKRRALRQQTIDLWQKWISSWEEQDLHVNVYQGLRLALEVGLDAAPLDPAMKAAHKLWQRSHRQLMHSGQICVS